MMPEAGSGVINLYTNTDTVKEEGGKEGRREEGREGGRGRTGGVEVTMLIHKICSVESG